MNLEAGMGVKAPRKGPLPTRQWGREDTCVRRLSVAADIFESEEFTVAYSLTTDLLSLPRKVPEDGLGLWFPEWFPGTGV